MKKYEVLKCKECGAYIDPQDMYCYECDKPIKKETNDKGKGKPNKRV